MAQKQHRTRPASYRLSSLRLTLGVVLFGAVAGACVTHFIYDAGFAGGILTGSLSMLLLLQVNRLVDKVFSNQSFALTLLARTMIYALVGAAATSLGVFVFGLADDPRNFSFQTLGAYWTEADWWLDIAIILTLSFLVSTVTSIATLVGPPQFWSFLTGHYHRPRREERVILFLDLVGSTRLAERLGDEVFYRLLQRVLAEAGDILVAHGAVIDRYIGDNITATWSLENKHSHYNCLAAMKALDDWFIAQRPLYEKTFNCQPIFRAVLHLGSITVGEVGNYKRELLLLGDSMNTAARIEAEAKRLDRYLVVSQALLDHVSLPEDLRAENLETFLPRGKSKGVTLFTILRQEGRELLAPHNVRGEDHE